MTAAAPPPAWIRRFRAARVTLPVWAQDAPQRAAYATNASGVWQLMSWDLDTDEHRQLTDKPTGVTGAAALPDGSGIVWFDDRAGDEVGRYVVTPFEGGAAEPLIAELPAAWSAGLSLRPAAVAVGLANADGFHIHVRDDGGLRLAYHHEHPADVGGLSQDAALLAVTHTEHGDTLHPALRVLDRATGDAVAQLWDGTGNTVVPAGWSRVPGDARVAVLADRTGKMRPEVFTAETGERVSLDLDLPGDVWVADWWPDGRALLLGHNHLGRSELYRYDLDRHAALRLELGTGTVRGARVRPDGSVWYAFTSSAEPAEVRVRAAGAATGAQPAADTTGGQPAAGAAPRDDVLLTPPGEPAPRGRAYTSLHYPNGEGDQVHAFLASPEGDGPFPLVVDVHGGPMAQDEDIFEARVQVWVDHGFAVLLCNYRGSTGYGKAWEDALIGTPGGPDLADVVAGRDHLVDEKIADPSRIALAGGSWGGYLTLLGLGRYPDRWNAGVAWVPVADYLAAYEDESPGLRELDRSLFGGTPEEVGELYRERSPITYVEQVRAPVLIITGANDTRCPRRQVDNYVAALAAHGKPHAYDVFEAGHGSLAVEETIRQYVLAIDFLAEHMGTPHAQR